jgi:hypothetical protein
MFEHHFWDQCKAACTNSPRITAQILSNLFGDPLANVSGGLSETVNSFAGGGVTPPPTVLHPSGLNTSTLNEVTVDATDQARAAVGVVEQPLTTHFLNMDCASCHTSTQISQRGDFVPTGRFRSPAGITGFAANDPTQVAAGQEQSGAWDFRNFGYLGNPSVSNRTVNESAAVADYINKNLLHLPGPGYDCSAADANDAVAACVLRGKSNCFAACTPPPAGVPPRLAVGTDALPLLADVPECAAATSSTSAPSLVLTGTTAKVHLGPDDSRCLSRIMAGSYVDGPVSVVCSAADQCEIDLTSDDFQFDPDAAYFTRSDEAFQRLFSALNVRDPQGQGNIEQTVNKSFSTHPNPVSSNAPGATIRCVSNVQTRSCSITVFKGHS